MPAEEPYVTCGLVLTFLYFFIICFGFSIVSFVESRILYKHIILFSTIYFDEEEEEYEEERLDSLFYY